MDVAYCTNIHSGTDLLAQLERTWPSIGQQMPAGRPLALGLWLSAQSARNFVEKQSVHQLREWLECHRLTIPTLNGFPFGDFHQARVKQDVYHPNWFQRSRWEYTLDLIEIVAELAPANSTASISTLPIAWRNPQPTREQLALAAEYLRGIAERLRQLKDQSGTTVRLCLEPEPGCYLQRSEDVVHFFNDYLLLDSSKERVIRDHIAVCHDICHAAVMFEPQRDALRHYQSAGISIGKIQVSSAIRADFHERLSDPERTQLRQQLQQFAEDRYLHQTTIRHNELVEFHDDLPEALAQNSQARGEWRVHFHVPIHLSTIGSLQTSQDDIREIVAAIAGDAVHHSCLFEVETYAWSVLPEDVRTKTLDECVFAELNWFHRLIEC